MIDCVRTLKILILVVLFSTMTARAADDSWQLGLQAFENRDYESALVFFQIARDAGQQGPAVSYNIGVCEYKTERYTDADRTFLSLGQQFPEFRALAAYNLGLIAQKLNRTDDARVHFRNSFESSYDDETLHSLSAEMLRRLSPEPVKTSAPGYGAFGIRAGYDDNVALRDELGLPAGTTAESPTADIFASIEWPVSGSGNLLFDASLYAVRYFDADEFDQNAIDVGIVYELELGAWLADAGIYANYGTLGGDGFDRGVSLRMRVSRRLTESAWLRLRFEHQEIEAADSVFAGIDGSRQKIEARYRWYMNDHSFTTRIQFETNDRASESVSPERLRFGVGYRYSPQTGWGFESGVEYRSSDYDGLAPPRTEDLMTIRIGASRTLKDGWQLLLNYQFSENDSTDSDFAYDRNLLSVGVIKLF